ncbi:olfactory receptor 52E8-like [Sphaeramia orbicularis]|uniref:Olfactory receptor 52E8-like n=1 Tax=Sphaeramia orbicularis TaxID=375764 RepID=A0A673ATV3_9TELE|nr:olfactory receptor 52E8-like [Sphaeramia orbicularis]
MMDNFSVITVFTLSGLSGIEKYKISLFFVTLLFYCVIWLVNVAVIVTIVVDKSLHEPMYIFLCNLCINGLYGTAGFYPKFLMDLLSTTHVISYAGCLLQGFVIHSSVSADFSLLVLMAFDRYVAICRPLVYHSMMTKPRVCVFLFFAWFIPIYLVFVGSMTTLTLRLCGSHIPKIYCINYLVGQLACSFSVAHVIVPAFNYSFFSCHFIFVIWSYIYLVKTCRTSRENRSKFIQTCLPHLFCLVTFGVSLLFDLLYIRFGSKSSSQSAQNFMAIEFLIIPPILNPLIYGFKMTQIRKRIIQFLIGKHI